MPIPAFRPDGYLPEGVHWATEEEVAARFGQTTERRRALLARVAEWLALARAVGARRLLLDGSFVTAKPEPGDGDAACWLPDDFEDQYRAGKPEAVRLRETLISRYPEEIFGVLSRERWEAWVRFFSQTREPDGRRFWTGGVNLMIANDQQLAIVSRQVEELRTERDRALEAADERPFQAHLEAAGFEKMIARLQEEIEAYEHAKAGEVPTVVTARVHDDSFAEVTSALVRLRLARGMRQEDLARASGKRQPSIARWESDDYDGYTLKELNRLARALGRELEVSFVLPSAAEGEEAPTG